MPPSSRKQLFVLAATLLLGALALKWWYRTATVDELAFLLKPVAHVIGLCSGETWNWIEGRGAYFPVAHIIIDRSCSGVNFLVITTAAFAFLLLKQPGVGCSWPALTLMSVVAAYVLSILANSGRILSMVWLQRMGFHLAPTTHEVVGALFFIVALVLACIALDRLLHRSSFHLDATS